MHPGIYRFEGKLSIPIQLVISSQLQKGKYKGLKLLAHGATIEDIKLYTEKAAASDNKRIRENASTVIDVCLSVNPNIKEAIKMYEAVKEVFKDAFAKERQNGINEEKERVAIDMIKKNYPLDAIKDISKLSEDIICNLATSLGLAIS